MAENKRTFAVVVLGESTEVTENVNEPLRVLVQKAVRETENDAGHQTSDWEVRDAKGGTPLDQGRKIEDFNFPAKVTLYVDLVVGGGG